MGKPATGVSHQVYVAERKTGAPVRLVTLVFAVGSGSYSGHEVETNVKLGSVRWYQDKRPVVG